MPNEEKPTTKMPPKVYQQVGSRLCEFRTFVLNLWEVLDRDYPPTCALVNQTTQVVGSLEMLMDGLDHQAARDHPEVRLLSREQCQKTKHEPVNDELVN